MRENQIQQFQNQHFGNLTVIEIDGEFFFIGKEVAELLGYKNTSRDVNRHVDEEDRCIFQNYQNGTFESPRGPSPRACGRHYRHESLRYSYPPAPSPQSSVLHLVQSVSSPYTASLPLDHPRSCRAVLPSAPAHRST